jgi:hypothetical protein
MGLFDRTPVDGCSLRLDPEVEAECYRIYWAERTWGKTDVEIMRYLAEGNAERGKAHLIDPVVTYGRRESLH